MTTPSSGPLTLSPAAAEDAAAFARLLGGTYVVPVEDATRKPVSDADLAGRVSMPVSIDMGLADWAVVRLGADETLSNYQYGMLDASERIVSQYFSHPAFHPSLADALRIHRGALSAAALPVDGWITNPQHPARRVLSSFYAIACGWQPELGNAAEAVRAQMENWLTLLARRERDWAEIADTSSRWLEDDHWRVARLEQRLVDAESGALRSRRARLLAARTLNQSMADRLIGAEVAAMLRNDWYAAMQWVLLSEGESGPLWQRMKRVTGSLRWTLSPEIGAENRSKLFRIVSQLNDDIEALSPLVFHDDAVRERVMSSLDAEHLRILRNEARQSVPFAPIEAHDVLADGAAVSENLLNRVRALTPGQWLLLKEGGMVKRVKMLLKQDDTQQLLFVNAQGVKAHVSSWEAFALRLANGDAEPLAVADPVAASIVSVVEELATRHRSAQQGRMEALRAAREHASADARAKEAARQKALAEAQALEAARHETRRKADEAQLAAETTQRNAAAARVAADAVTQDTARQRARLMASSLTIGAWLAFRSPDGRIERRRLTVILPSSGKYIFVDAEGIRKQEVMRDELVHALASGDIALLNKDQRLDDALTRVVDNLRHERGTGGQ